MKIFEKFMKKERRFLVKEENLIEVIKMLQNVLNGDEMILTKFIFKLIFNEEKYMELIEVDMNDDQWYKLLELCKNNNYKLIVDQFVDKRDCNSCETVMCFKKEIDKKGSK